MSVIEIQKMSNQDKLVAMELLWESLDTNNAVKPPEWHKEEVANRLKSIDAGETTTISLAALRKKFTAHGA